MADNKSGEDATSVADDQMQTYDDGIVTLTTEDGESIDLIDIARINYGNDRYAIMQPVQLAVGMKEDEAFVFRVIESENQDDVENFMLVLDDEIAIEVFKEYNKLYEEMKNSENSQVEEK